eukprot:359944-Chlamydomonas_euryale.AAC.4
MLAILRSSEQTQAEPEESFHGRVSYALGIPCALNAPCCDARLHAPSTPPAQTCLHVMAASRVGQHGSDTAS